MNVYHADIWTKNYAAGVAPDMPLDIRPVFALLDDTAHRFGDRPAFDFLGKVYTWAELANAANHFAKGLQARGYGPGSTIGLLLPNCPFYLVAYYGALKAGCRLVNFNPLYSAREIKAQIDDSGTELLVTLDLAATFDKARAVLETTHLKGIIVCRFIDVLPFPKNLLYPLLRGREIAGEAHNGNYDAFEDYLANDGKPASVSIDPVRDVALLQYTGGTTGTPKGAMLTHANIVANVNQCIGWFPGRVEGQGKMLGVIPFFHVFAMTAVMNFAVRLGMQIIATPRFDITQTLKLIQKHKPTLFPAVPAIYNAINHHPQLAKYDLHSIKFCISGGAPLPVEVKKSFEHVTGGIVLEGYGLSEASPVVCVNPTAGENRPGSIGLPLPHTTIEIISLEDGVSQVPIGEKGELCVRGPQVMQGYWGKPDETAHVLKDGLLRTGDVAIMDADGYVTIVDRIKDMIIVNGFKVYPRNVEEVIYEHKDVEECIVAGLPDPVRGEMVKAWIKPKTGTTIDVDEMTAFIRARLSPIEVPKAIEVRDTPLPKTLIGKLSRKDMVAEALAQQTKA